MYAMCSSLRIQSHTHTHIHICTPTPQLEKYLSHPLSHTVGSRSFMTTITLAASHSSLGVFVGGLGGYVLATILGKVVSVL